MSSAETPPDPNEPEPSDEELDAFARNWFFWASCVVALMLAAIGYGEATGKIHFF